MIIISKFIDLTKQKFGRLTVIERDFEKQGDSKKTYWKCECDCEPNKIVSVRADALKNGITLSCGCYHKNIASKISTNKKYNQYQIDGNITIIFTTDNNYILIDTEDYDKVKKYCWSISSNGYAQARDYDKYNSCVLMHRIIMDAPNNKVVDHKNHIILDNRKENLRICKQRNNMANSNLSKANTSGYKGVYWSNEKNKWYVKIGYKNNIIHLGYFDNIQEAFKIRLEAEEIYFGEYKNVIKYDK